jgi:polyferredoxin
MQAGIGKSIIVIGGIHSAFGFVVFRSTLAEIIREGLVNTVNGQPIREFAFWFIVFGFLAIIFGTFVDWCERQSVKLPKFFGWSLLALTLIIVTIMPISGGWLLFIPTIGAILRSRPSAILPSESLDGGW